MLLCKLNMENLYITRYTFVQYENIIYWPNERWTHLNVRLGIIKKMYVKGVCVTLCLVNIKKGKLKGRKLKKCIYQTGNKIQTWELIQKKF